MAKSIYVNDDAYWYLRRYRVSRKLKSNDAVLRKMFEVIKDKPDKFRIVFDVEHRQSIPQGKNAWTVQDEDLYWMVEEYGNNCKLKFQDLAVFNIIGHCMELEGDW